VSAVLKEETFELSAEHDFIYRYLKEIREDIKHVSEKLDAHLGYHTGIESRDITVTDKVIELLKVRPWISLVVGAVVVLTGAVSVADVLNYFGVF